MKTIGFLCGTKKFFFNYLFIRVISQNNIFFLSIYVLTNVVDSQRSSEKISQAKEIGKQLNISDVFYYWNFFNNFTTLLVTKDFILV